MTDKVQKIREEVERLINQKDENKYLGIVLILELKKVLSFIDSLQEEPKTDWLQELQEKLDSLSKEDFKKVWDKYSRYGEEEPVSEELADAAITAADEDMQGRQIMEESNENRQLYSRIFRRGFKAGAKWQLEQINEALLSEVLPCFMHGGEADEVVAKLDEVLNQKK